MIPLHFPNRESFYSDPKPCTESTDGIPRSLENQDVETKYAKHFITRRNNRAYLKGVEHLDGPERARSLQREPPSSPRPAIDSSCCRRNPTRHFRAQPHHCEKLLSSVTASMRNPERGSSAVRRGIPAFSRSSQVPMDRVRSPAPAGLRIKPAHEAAPFPRDGYSSPEPKARRPTPLIPIEFQNIPPFPSPNDNSKGKVCPAPRFSQRPAASWALLLPEPDQDRLTAQGLGLVARLFFEIRLTPGTCTLNPPSVFSAKRTI